jgi:hypothetical protein
MKFALVTTVEFPNPPSGRLAAYEQSRAFIEGLADEVGAIDGAWLHGAAAADGMSVALVTEHSDAFAARATRHRISTLFAAQQLPPWATGAGAPTFGIVGLHSQADAFAGLPRRKPVPHI